MAFVFFAQSMFGSLIAIRILRKFRDRSLISTTCLTKIGTAFALASTFLPILDPRLSFFIVIVALVMLYFILVSVESHRIAMMVRHFPRFLDQWLLNLRVGHGPRTAAQAALQGSEKAFQVLIRPILNSSIIPTDARRHLFLRDRIVLELHLAQNQAHNTVNRLESLRELVLRESEFRRKSGQALNQARIQSTVMVALHLALSLFVVTRVGWFRARDLLVISSLLTAAGVLTLRWMARRVKWSI